MRHFAALLVMTGVAHASPGLWAIPAPGDGAIRATVETDLSRHHAFEPTTIAPDLIVGVVPDTALLLSTSRASVGRLGAGSGFCVVGSHETLDMQSAECAERARGFGIAALHALSDHVDARAGLETPSATPFTLAASAGLMLHVERGVVWMQMAPSFSAGVIGRNAGNTERVLLPIYAGVTIGRFDLHVRTGIEGALATFGDTLAIPLGAGTSIAIGRARLGAEACLDHAFGEQNTLARRSANLFLELPFERLYR